MPFTSGRNKGSGVTNVGTKEKPIWVKEGATSYDIANARAAARESEIRGLFDNIVDTYSPGGSYMKGQEAALQREKQKYVGSATQNLISSGLYGTSALAGVPNKFEETVGVPTRAKLEDMRTQAYTNALAGKADFINSITESVPDFGTIAQLQAQASSAPQQSLDDWLHGTFQGQGFGGTPKVRTGQTAAEQQAIKEKLANYASPMIENQQPLYGGIPQENAMMGYGEAAREARKKAGYYLDSNGNLKKI